MEAILHRVNVVFDHHFGDRLTLLAETGPVWVVNSPANAAAAKLYWGMKSTTSHTGGLTVFKADGASSPQDALLAELDTIELHHGEYSTLNAYNMIEVFGASRTAVIDLALGELGFDRFENTESGFLATRRSKADKCETRQQQIPSE